MRPTEAMLATFGARADQVGEALAGHRRLSPGAGGAIEPVTAASECG
jgi:hypothetical protein